MKLVVALLLGAGLLHVASPSCQNTCYSDSLVSCLNNEVLCTSPEDCSACYTSWNNCLSGCRRKRELRSRFFRDVEDNEDKNFHRNLYNTEKS